jgi:hypothetical protein
MLTVNVYADITRVFGTHEQVGLRICQTQHHTLYSIIVIIPRYVFRYRVTLQHFGEKLSRIVIIPQETKESLQYCFL